MNKKLLLIGLFVFMLFKAVEVEAKDKCDLHPIYCQIIDNKPAINRQYAMKLSNIIHRKAKQYDIKAYLITAILMQESGYDYTVKRGNTGLRTVNELEFKAFNTNCDKDYEQHRTIDKFAECLDSIPIVVVDTIYTDFGIGQIHYSNLFAFSFDVNKLTTDLEYSVEAAFIVLNDVKKIYFDKELYWWTRYHSSTPSFRKKYRKMVERWM